MIDQKKGNQKQGNYGNRRYGRHGENDFNKGTAKPVGNYNNRRNDMGSWKQEDTEEKQKLRQAALEMKKKLSMSKNVEQKIRLIMNVISPDNFDKKLNELRGFMFEGFKTKEECEDEDIEYVLAEHQLHEENLNLKMLEMVVENIFRKASIEKEYVIFYGNLCEKLIKLELDLRGLQFKRTDLRNSVFRKTMIQVCKE